MNFQDLNLKIWVNKTLEDFGYNKMSEIQAKTIPLQLKNKNIIGVSATGSGKTLSFLIPIINNINLDNKLQSIIIVPTRELARQINSVINNFKKHQNKLRNSLLIGGSEFDKQIKNILTTKPQIVVATIQRLKEAITHKKLNFQDVKFLTIDEADMVFDLGFFADIDAIFKNLNFDSIIKTAWSATLHPMLSIQLSKYYKNTKIIEIGKSIYENEKIVHKVIHTNDKEHALAILLKKINPYICLIFANKKVEVEKIYKFLKNNGYNVALIHGSLNSRERKNIYKEIKLLKYQYVVASDLASRGLDIDGVSHVVSFNIPNDNEWYIHRAGRTGRGKYSGESWIIASQSDDKSLLFFKNKGLSFLYFTIKNNKLISSVYRLNNKKVVLDEETRLEIKKTIQKKRKVVKPNYKKKKKQEIDKLKRKSKRKFLDNKIKQEMIKKYKMQNSIKK